MLMGVAIRENWAINIGIIWTIIVGNIRMGNYVKWVWWGTSIAIPVLGPHGKDLM